MPELGNQAEHGPAHPVPASRMGKDGMLSSRSVFFRVNTQLYALRTPSWGLLSSHGQSSPVPVVPKAYKATASTIAPIPQQAHAA